MLPCVLGKPNLRVIKQTAIEFCFPPKTLALRESEQRKATYDQKNQRGDKGSAPNASPVGRSLAKQFSLRHNCINPPLIEDVRIDAVSNLKQPPFSASDPREPQPPDYRIPSLLPPPFSLSASPLN